MKIHSITVKHTPSPGPIQRQFPKVKSLPEGLTIPIKYQLTVLLGPNGTGKSTFLKGLHSRGRKKIFEIQHDEQYTPTQMFNIYDKEGNEIKNIKAWGNDNRQNPARHNTIGLKGKEFVEPITINGTVSEQEKGFISSGQHTILEVHEAIADAKREEIVLLLDEPGANVDIAQKNILLTALKETIEEGIQLFLATHDILLLLSLQTMIQGDIGVIEFTNDNNPVTLNTLQAYIATLSSKDNPYLSHIRDL